MELLKNRTAMYKLSSFLNQLITKLPGSQISPQTSGKFACGFIVLSTIATYGYGVIRIIPELFAEFPVVLTYFIQLMSTWIASGILVNMYLVRKRTSSIQNRMLLQPVVKPMTPPAAQINTDVHLRETAKHVGEHFMAAPFGDNSNWHICAVCEVFVPPRTWHCSVCNTCILRRGHHCIFTGCCVGEENHSNFIGLLLYLSVGTTLVSIFCLIYGLYFENLGFWWYLFRIYCAIYSIFVDFDVRFILASISSVGMWAAWGVLGYYLVISMRGQTSADSHRKIIRIPAGKKPTSYENMCDFLGPAPLLRIIWPFHPPFKTQHGAPTVSPEEARKHQ